MEQVACHPAVKPICNRRDRGAGHRAPRLARRRRGRRDPFAARRSSADRRLRAGV